MKRIILMLLLCIYTAEAFANVDRPPIDTLVTDANFAPAKMDLRPYIAVSADEKSTLWPPENFQHQNHIFHPGIKNNGQVNDYWLKLVVKNTSSKALSYRFFTGWHDCMYWYRQPAGQPMQQLMATGLMIDDGGVERWHHYAFHLQVAPNETCTFYLHIINKSYNENPMMPVLFSEEAYNIFHDEQLDSFRKEAVIIQVLLGMLLVFFSISIINYVQLPDRSYLYFAAYILGLILFFALRLDSKPFQLSFFHQWPMLKYYWDIPGLLFCFYLMYLLFGNAFLNLKDRYPFMEKGFTWMAAVVGGLIILCTLCIAFDKYHLPTIIYSYVYFLTLAPLLAVFIALARRSRHHPLVRFFLYGSACLYLACLGSFLLQVKPLGLLGALGELAAPTTLLMGGVLLQAMFFLAGLSYRNKLVHLERTRTQELLIKQLNKNKELQRKLNEQLEELVREQTTEILRKKQELEEQRKIQLETEYDKKLTEIELKAIRAQINPHFIFNCLNSIQLFVMQRDYEFAQKYLSDFSYLIRKTLDFSRRNFISLSEEITYLNTYLGLEKMRFENRMEYEIVVDPEIIAAELEIPAMLLQPYVENAVKHGMTNPKQPTGLLRIYFNQVAPDMLECVIADNGIGIARSKSLRTLPKHHQSSGMEISQNRAELLNKMYRTDIHIEIIDKSVEDEANSGTIVKIFIPQL
ncbi:signal transduction histidine kinase [Chitinophaga terrae (ex Kim and Jung 2007)]|uniref:histidine kinase n=1 Tax=Chitinophaga terrae (ex Kim and Jung 2007) TaxID=408074 RepID=UPI002785B364|nr:histidine kinase [Chitinophaga terrae (ex Kim and Jung 2007)]MDQ0105693.1 signal transduction histidine kinase [Chitinophaga terrae (ex Kim and Jung 2007)]